MIGTQLSENAVEVMKITIGDKEQMEDVSIQFDTTDSRTLQLKGEAEEARDGLDHTLRHAVELVADTAPTNRSRQRRLLWCRIRTFDMLLRGASRRIDTLTALCPGGEECDGRLRPDKPSTPMDSDIRVNWIVSGQAGIRSGSELTWIDSEIESESKEAPRVRPG